MAEDACKKCSAVMTRSVMSVYVVDALSSFIFGYETGISGGVTIMKSFLKSFFPSIYKDLDTPANPFSKFDDPLLSTFTSSLYVALLVAALLAPWLRAKLGMRTPMVIACFSLVSGASLNMAAAAIWMLVGGRLLLGFGLGLSYRLMSLYSRITPFEYGSPFDDLQFEFSFMWFGVLAANSVNMLSHELTNGYSWRIGLGGAVLPALAALFFVWFLPADTPDSLLEKGQSASAGELLRCLRGSSVDDAEIERELKGRMDILAALSKRPWRDLILKRQHRPHLLTATFLPLFQQLTGRNILMLFSPILFKAMGLGEKGSLWAAMVAPTINIFSPICSLLIAHRFGRRIPLLVCGGLIFILQLVVACAWGWPNPGLTQSPDCCGPGIGIMVCGVALLCLSSCWSHASLVVLIETLPLEIGAAAAWLISTVIMISYVVFAQFSLTLLAHLKLALFLVAAMFLVFMIDFVYLFLPKETWPDSYGRVVYLWNQHWLWRRFMPQDGLSSEPPQDFLSSEPARSSEKISSSKIYPV